MALSRHRRKIAHREPEAAAPKQSGLPLGLAPGVIRYFEKRVTCLEVFRAASRQAVSRELVLPDGVDDELKDAYLMGHDTHVARQINLLWDHAKTPLDLLFGLSFYMCLVRHADPMGLVVTAPMLDITTGIPALVAEVAEQRKDLLEASAEVGEDVGGLHVLQTLETAEKDGLYDDVAELRRDKDIAWNYLTWNLDAAVHLTPQAGFPGGLEAGQDLVADFAIWSPGIPTLRIILELEQDLVTDETRALRNAAFLRLGWRSIRFTRSEVHKAPLAVALRFYEELVAEASSRLQPADPVTSRG